MEEDDRKKSDRYGWKMMWSGVGLIVLNILLGALSMKPEMLGLSEDIYIGIVLILCIIDVVLVYLVIRRFFGKK